MCSTPKSGGCYGCGARLAKGIRLWHTNDMNLSHIRERLADGFRPFVVELTNGRRFEVPHPEFLIVGKNVIGVRGTNDVITTIDALHIVTVKDLPPKAPRRKRSR